MALVLMATHGWGQLWDTQGNVQVGAQASFTTPALIAATHYANAVGGAPSTGPVTADINGRLMRYIEEGSYIQTLPGGSTLEVQAVSGATVTAVEGRVGQLGVNVEAAPYNASPAATAAANFAAISSAITAAGILGAPVLFPTKGATYAISQVLLNPLGMPMVGDDVTIDGSGIAAAGALSTQFAMKVEGSLSGSALVSTGAFTAGSAVLAIPTATLAAGDTLLVASSTQLYMTGVSGATEKRQELRRVKSIDSGSQCTLTEGLRFSYTSGATTTARKINMVDRPRVEGVNFTMGGFGKVHNGILFTYCTDAIVKRVKIDGCEDTGVQFSYCWGGTVEGSDIANCTSPTPVGVTGYGVTAVDATRDIKVHKTRISNCRHAVASGSCAVDGRVFDCDIEGNGINSGASLDCHEATFGWCFDFNRISGALSVGVLIRGQGGKARWNVIRNSGSHGIYIKSFDTNTAGLNDTEVIGNDIESTLGAGIRSEGTSTCRVQKIKIAHNRCKNNTLNNVTLILTDDVEYLHNDLDGLLSGSGNDGQNLRIVGSSTSDRCERVTVRGGTYKNCNVKPIRADFTNGLYIYVDNITGTGTSLMTSCLDAFVWGHKTSFVTTNMAAATTMTLTQLLNNTLRVSGATQIDTIDAAGFEGETVTLIFSGTPVVSEAGNLLLVGSFSATGNDVLHLTSDGTSWYEAGRNAN